MKRRYWPLIILLLILVLLILELIFRPEVFRNSLASFFYNRGNFEKAEQLFAKNNADEVSLANKGKALYQEGKAEQSAQTFDEALDLAEDKAGHYYDKGNAAFQTGDFQSAIENYAEALKLDPRDEDAKANLELAIRKLKQNPPPPPQSGKDEQQKRSEEETRNILEALDNQEAQNRKDKQSQAPHRSKNWW